MPSRAKKEKMPKAPKMRKPRLGRARGAGRSAAGKPGQKQSQKIVVNIPDKQPFAFPQQQGLTLQDLINFEATRGQRLGTREEPQAVKELVPTETKVKPNLETLGSILMKEEPVMAEAGSLESLKTKKRPVLSEASSSFELNKPKPVKVTNEFLNQLENEIDQIIKPKPKPVLSNITDSIELNKSRPKPKPLLSEESGSLEIMKSQMKPKPVLSEASSSFELNKPKMKPKSSDVMSQTVEEVFNKPITTKSIFEQIAQTQGITPESIQGLQPPSPTIEPVKKQRKTRSDKGISRKEEAFLQGYTIGSAEGINAGADIGVKEGIPLGRDIQNQYVMDVEKMQERKIQPGQLRLVTNEERKIEPSFQSSSSNLNFA